MSLLSSLRSLVTALVNRGRIENDTDEELRAHVQNRADDLEHSGLTRAEAERRARIEFGGHEKFREECRETGGGNLVQVLIQDSRYALRILRRTPLVTAVAVLSLALGIGANTAIFGLIDTVMLRLLPVAEPGSWSRYSEMTLRALDQPFRVSPTPCGNNYATSKTFFSIRFLGVPGNSILPRAARFTMSTGSMQAETFSTR